MTPPESSPPRTALRRVGPAGSLPSDSQFGVALTTLWHAVSRAGGSVGFPPSVERPAVAAAAAAVVEDLRRGRAEAVALIADRQLAGFAELVPGTGLTAHTGSITAVMVDPALQRERLGTVLLTELLGLARGLGVERVTMAVRDGAGLEAFYARFGFVEWGRRPGWVRMAAGDDRDEIFLFAELG